MNSNLEDDAYRNAEINALRAALLATLREVSAISPGAEERVIAEIRNGAEKLEPIKSPASLLSQEALREVAGFLEGTWPLGSVTTEDRL